MPTLFSGRLTEDGATGIAGRTNTMTLGRGGTMQSCVPGPTDATGSAGCTIVPNQPQGPGTVTAAFLGDAFYLPSSDTKATIFFAFLASGAFAIGDGNAAVGNNVTYWGAKWARLNTVSGGDAPSAFKGFASNTAEPPACGLGWSARPGNLGDPPDSVPAYMGVIVTSSVTKHGPDVTGNTVSIVVVKTNPGYAGNPGPTRAPGPWSPSSASHRLTGGRRDGSRRPPRVGPRGRPRRGTSLLRLQLASRRHRHRGASSTRSRRPRVRH